MHVDSTLDRARSPRWRHARPNGWILLLLLWAPGLLAQPIDQDPFGTSGEFGAVGDRENTRLMGTVLDERGDPLTGVHVWVVNDKAPAERVRGRTRKTGNYLVRGMAPLYTEHDMHGITARARFEKEGYREVVARIAIPKNGVERLYPILVREDATLDATLQAAVFVGKVTNAKGKGVKRAVIEARRDGEVIASSEPTKGSGEFELVVWDTGPELELAVLSRGAEKLTRMVQVPPRPQPDVLVALEASAQIEE